MTREEKRKQTEQRIEDAIARYNAGEDLDTLFAPNEKSLKLRVANKLGLMRVDEEMVEEIKEIEEIEEDEEDDCIEPTRERRARGRRHLAD